jgi:ketosteroid isomerase-like protein
MTSKVEKKVESDGLALTHAHLTLVSIDGDGNPVEFGGRATLVSRRQPDGTWRIVLDDPLSPE